ncbi:hypothetical protein CFC21_049752 [Triticum aestivum]|uniref:BTB domain-containing protein n=1 Tax=Triticum aestivum TaxID=4565 RepID=A0A9R1K3R5_WHEAT|nr:BTB/POZ and MATH domain-containing protein 1-like [Triticum aestivum]KAF7039806.1 hypothetical protein CFC21_049752 [Triticum aestivum]
MSTFAGVSVLDGDKPCSCVTSGVGAGAGASSVYHLLVVKGYSGIKKELPNGESWCTELFRVEGHEYSIEYYPNGANPNCADFISLDITRLYDEDVEEGVEAKFSFSLVDDVEKQMPTYIRATRKTRDFRRCDPCWGCDKFMRRDALERSASLKSDCFTIRCDIVVCKDNTPDATGSGTSTGTEVLLPDIHQHFSNLLQNKVGADVTFEVGGETFAAHRCVLAARSEVFMVQLFGTAMPSVIQITDMEAKVFRALLCFIYTDSCPEMEKNSMEEDEMPGVVEQGQVEEVLENKTSEVVEQTQEEAVEDEILLQWLQDLFVAADRYNLQRLKFICEKQLCEHVGVSSVASTLALAEQHHCHGLKAACLKFIQVLSPSRLQALMATDGWGHIATTYPSVLYELIAILASNQRK